MINSRHTQRQDYSPAVVVERTCSVASKADTVTVELWFDGEAWSSTTEALKGNMHAINEFKHGMTIWF